MIYEKFYFFVKKSPPSLAKVNQGESFLQISANFCKSFINYTFTLICKKIIQKFIHFLQKKFTFYSLSANFCKFLQIFIHLDSLFANFCKYLFTFCSLFCKKIHLLFTFCKFLQISANFCKFLQISANFCKSTNTLIFILNTLKPIFNICRNLQKVNQGESKVNQK